MILACEQVREIDRLAVRKLGIPSLLLMENAGRSLVDCFIQCFPETLPENRANVEKGRPEGSGCQANPGFTVLICCGKGNNGGDGFVMARRFCLLGIRCKILLAARPEDYHGDAGIQLGILSNILDGDDFISWPEVQNDPEFLQTSINASPVLVDALLGTGIHGAIRPPFDRIIPMLNHSGRPVFSVDLPSGLDADTGSAELAVRAAVTCTLAAKKPGLLLPAAQEFVGKLYVGDIGIPVEPLLPFVRSM